MNRILFVPNPQRSVRIRCPNMPHSWACNLSKKTEILTVDQNSMPKKKQVEKAEPKPKGQKVSVFHNDFHF